LTVGFIEAIDAERHDLFIQTKYTPLPSQGEFKPPYDIKADKLPALMLSQWVVKSSVEILFTPLTYKIVNSLKEAEAEDYYDRETDFNPFTLKGA
jgi:uncharacterized PurR-regulated membrane protein YhhQ (DUF165 family)